MDLLLDFVSAASLAFFFAGDFSDLILSGLGRRNVARLGSSYLSVAYRLLCSGLTSSDGGAAGAAKVSRVCFLDLRGGIGNDSRTSKSGWIKRDETGSYN